MKWLVGLGTLVFLIYASLSIFGMVRAFGPVDHSSAQVARKKLSDAAKWISSLQNLTDGQELSLPPNLKGMIGSGGSVTVRRYDEDLWIVIECYVENIDNGEGYAYCIHPKKDSIPKFTEQQLTANRIDQNWVYFRFT